MSQKINFVVVWELSCLIRNEKMGTFLEKPKTSKYLLTHSTFGFLNLPNSWKLLILKEFKGKHSFVMKCIVLNFSMWVSMVESENNYVIDGLQSLLPYVFIKKKNPDVSE